MTRGDLLYVGDVHLDAGDPAVDEFVRFLDDVGRRAGTLVLMGDLFNLWVGRPELEQPHHRAVAGALAGLRSAGVRVEYVEGNRDFRIADAYLGKAFDAVSDRGLVHRRGPVSLLAVHGDMANPDDRAYRAWRRLARSRAMWAFLNVLPLSRRYRFAAWLDRRLQGANLAFKQELPEQRVRDYAAPFLERGHAVVVLGHYHVERDLDAPPGRILITPLWRDTHRYLRVDPSGTPRFESWGQV